MYFDTNSSEESQPPASNWRQRCTTQFQSTLLWRSYFLAWLLHDAVTTAAASVHKHFEARALLHQAFRVALLGLETPRAPAASKSLEAKLINQEHELAALLKRLGAGVDELALVRDRAARLVTECERPRPPGHYWGYSLPLLLAAYLFDTLHPLGRDDRELAFRCALAALGLKAHLSESQYSLLCEGIRRQKGDLALILLVTYKGMSVCVLIGSCLPESCSPVRPR